jgi:hypothetical protein
MADITLADYTGYIFLEIIKARQMADLHSAELAKVYAQDPVLKYFSVPRFKIPRMELTIPVLISGAQFNQTLGFGLKEGEFVGFVYKVLNQAIQDLNVGLDKPGSGVKQFAFVDGGGANVAPAGTEGQARAFWAELNGHPELATSAPRVLEFWQRAFKTAIRELHQEEAVQTNGRVFEQLMSRPPEPLVETLKAKVVIATTKVQSLLINPETNVVKNGSSDTSVFTIKAEMLEEGFFVRTLKDEATGQETSVVEFE